MSGKTERILILGGYGTFGSRIAEGLVVRGYSVIINGRQVSKANRLTQQILNQQPSADISAACFDVQIELAEQLQLIKPRLVIHTCGPFQGQDLQVPKTVIQAGCHYIDLSDSRDYVQQMMGLDDLAQNHQVAVITAASTVPALSSAVLSHLQQRFELIEFDQVNMGISPGQRTDRGLATTRAVLSYIGKPLRTWPGNQNKKYGWQNLYLQHYPTIRNRLMGNCEAPDLDLFEQAFAIKQLNFAAGMESKLLHVLIWMTSWLIRLGLPITLEKHAAGLLAISRWFDALGTADGGMHVHVIGTNQQHERIEKTWFIEAFENDGPQIPSMPAVLMAEKIIHKKIGQGVKPCLNLITLEEYLDALKTYKVTTQLT